MDATNAFFWLLVTPLLAGPLIYLIGRYWAREKAESDMQNPARWMALLALVAEAAMIFFAAKGYLSASDNPLQLNYGMVVMHFDGLSLLLALTVLVLGMMVTIYSFTYMQAEVGEEKYYALLVMMIGMIIGLGCANDLFNLWIWFEGMAITSFMLVAFYRDSNSSLEAGVKYLVQSAVGSVFVLLGIALTFAQTGVLDLDVMAETTYTTGASPILLAAGAFFLIGFGVKTALVPMHTWLPDAHSQAPSGISAMLSGVVISAGLVALLRAISPFIILTPMWTFIILGFGALNILAGNLMALRQTQVKRLLAYSSLAHIGYMLIGIGVTLGTGSPTGAEGGFFHLVTHMLMKGLAFLAVGALLYVFYVAKGHHGPLMVEDLNGAAKRYPLVALALSIALLGLGGLPPLAGFMSKWQIFISGFQTQNTWVIALVIFAGVNSVLSLGYYAPLVNRLYRLEPSEMVKEGRPASIWLQAPLMLLALAIVVLGVWPTLLSWLYTPAANAFIQGILPW